MCASSSPSASDECFTNILQSHFPLHHHPFMRSSVGPGEVSPHSTCVSAVSLWPTVSTANRSSGLVNYTLLHSSWESERVHHVQEESKDRACTNTSALHTACIESTLPATNDMDFPPLSSASLPAAEHGYGIECLATGKVIRRSTTVVWVETLWCCPLACSFTNHLALGGVGPSYGVS